MTRPFCVLRSSVCGASSELRCYDALLQSQCSVQELEPISAKPKMFRQALSKTSLRGINLMSLHTALKWIPRKTCSWCWLAQAASQAKNSPFTRNSLDALFESSLYWQKPLSADSKNARAVQGTQFTRSGAQQSGKTCRTSSNVFRGSGSPLGNMKGDSDQERGLWTCRRGGPALDEHAMPPAEP